MTEPPPEHAQPHQSAIAGKLIALGLPLVIVVVTVALGVVFSQRDRRHREGRLDGAALYARYCTSCHGPDAQGAGAVASLRPLRLEAEAFKAQVSQGKGAMPGFQGQLFDSDYERLYRYLQALDSPGK
ncbi:MAG: cytochrome c [Planctomycetes bacterium]|nr:cytochrome c [Planctomycetota bacterium]